MAGSETEIRTREGFPYGGLPHDALLYKLEETDPDLVAEVRGADPLDDIGEAYRNYVRAEAIDRTPDAPYLESDHPTRDAGGLSRSRLNLTYNGTRGSDAELPRHPELFYGFTDNDPRGALLDPRFDQMRGQIDARAANLTVRMGDSDDNDVAERPWTNQAISYGMKEVQRRLKNSTRVFSVQKEGRPWGRNTVARALALGADPRSWSIGVGAESLGGDAGRSRFVSGDHLAAGDRLGAVRRGRGLADEISPWRHTAPDASMGGQRQGPARGAARRPELARFGGGQARVAGADQGWADTEVGRSPSGRGAQIARPAAGAGTRGDQRLPGGRSGAPRGTGAGWVARDSARARRAAVEDQARQTGPGEGSARLGPAAGLTPAARPERALRSSEAAAAGAPFSDAGAPVAGVRQGTAAGRRRVAGMARPQLAGGGAAAGLSAPAFRAAAPGRPEARAETARDAFDPRTWRAQAAARRSGSARTPGWRSATQGGSVLGAPSEQTFGFADEVAGGSGAATGPKRLRAGTWSASARLADGDPGFAGGA